MSLMIRVGKVVLFLAVFFAANASAFAHPEFLAAYKADKFTNPANKDRVCNFCHMSASGGDERNVFGKAFEAGGETFTPMLRAQFPDRFSYPVTKVSDTLTIHFSDPNNKVVVVESGGQRVAVDVDKRTVDGKEAATADGAVAAMIPAHDAGAGAAQANLTTPAAKPAVPTDPLAREGAFFGQSVTDLPNGKSEKKGAMEFWLGHRFPEKTFQRSSPADLFGLDSVATVAFGLRVGLTNRVSVAIVRSSFSRTIELSSTFQVARQSDGMPVTLQLRGTVESRNNFYKPSTGDWPGYEPSIQVVAVRTFRDRLSLEAVPTFAFNTRDENSPVPAALQYGIAHNNTIALGLGMGVRVLPTTSLVAEVIPRLYGYRGHQTDRPEISFGVQKSTFRHTFELVFSDMQAMTVARYAQGTGGGTGNGALDTFGIGFNIYRKLK